MEFKRRKLLNHVVLNQRHVECTKMFINLVVLNMPRRELELKNCGKDKRDILMEWTKKESRPSKLKCRE